MATIDKQTTFIQSLYFWQNFPQFWMGRASCVEPKSFFDLEDGRVRLERGDIDELFYAGVSTLQL